MTSATISSDPSLSSTGVDPLAQTFRTPVDATTGGKYLYSVKLLFARKSDPTIASSLNSYSGVTMEIRETFNGYPTGPEGIIGRTYTTSNDINVLTSNSTTLDTSKYTSFLFQEPIFLENNKEYAIVIYPDGNSPDYLAWIGRIGEKVFATNIQYTTQDSVTPGVLFVSTNQTAWSAIQTEDLVYDVQAIVFDETQGHVTLIPNDYEFLTFGLRKDKNYTFNPSTYVAQVSNTYGAGQLKYTEGPLKFGPTYLSAIPEISLFSDPVIEPESYILRAANGSPSLSSFNEGDGILVFRVEETMATLIAAPAACTSATVLQRNNAVTIAASCTEVNAVDIPNANITGIAKGDFLVLPVVNSSLTFAANPANSAQTSVIRQVVSVTNTSQFFIDAPVSTGETSDIGFWVANTIKTFATVVQTSDTTSITLKDFVPTEFAVYTSTGEVATSPNVAYSYQKTAVGVVEYVNYIKNKLVLEGSSADSASPIYKFRASNSTFLGTLVATNYTNTTSFSTSFASLSSIDSVVMDRVSAYVRNFVPLGTTLTPTFYTYYTSSNGAVANSTVSSSLRLNSVTPINYNAILPSKSLWTNAAPFALKLDLASEANTSSPKVTIYPASVVVHSAIINSNTSNENYANNNGAALAKYVSKPTTLASSMDAEDIFVYVTAFRPQGSDIKVYAKIRAREDSRRIDDIEWSELAWDQNEDLYSIPGNLADYKEYRFTFKKKPDATVLTGTAQYTNAQANLTGLNTTWSTGTPNLQSNDVILIVDATDPTLFDIGIVDSVANNTRIALKTILSDNGVYTTNQDGLTIQKLTHKQQAFKYPGNDNIVKYYNGNLASFDTYQQYAIKIVMTRSVNGVVPYINDVRAIATSV